MLKSYWGHLPCVGDYCRREDLMPLGAVGLSVSVTLTHQGTTVPSLPLFLFHDFAEGRIKVKGASLFFRTQFQTVIFSYFSAYWPLPGKVPVVRPAQQGDLQPGHPGGGHQFRRRALGVSGHQLRLQVAGFASLKTCKASCQG